MSQLLIQHCLNQLADPRKVSGTHREAVVREAFIAEDKEIVIDLIARVTTVGVRTVAITGAMRLAARQASTAHPGQGGNDGLVGIPVPRALCLARP